MSDVETHRDHVLRLTDDAIVRDALLAVLDERERRSHHDAAPGSWMPRFSARAARSRRGKLLPGLDAIEGSLT